MTTFLPVERWVQTPLGQALWLAVIDYGVSHNPIYLVEMSQTGEHRCIDMREIRGLENYTFDIPRPKEVRNRDSNL